MPRTRPTFTEITETLTSDTGLSAKDRAQFHYFNPRGVYADKRAADEEIAAAVDAGLMRTGAHIAYGTFNDFGVNLLMKAATAARPRRFKVDQAIRWVRDDAAKARRKIAEARAAAS